MLNTDILLRDDRVLLRAIGEAELDRTRAWANDPALHRLILRTGEVTPSDQLRWFARLQEDRTRLVFAVYALPEMRHIGNTGFYQIDSTHGRADFWILLGDSAGQGRRLGSATLELMLAYGFNVLGLHKISLQVGENNTRARRLYENHGFCQEALLREHYLIEGQRVNVIVMSLLRSEYHGEK